MRDSINYNLNYFIVRTSGTKPMKNTMRKPSPLKFADITAALSTPEGRAKYEASRPKGTVTRNTSARDAATVNPRSASGAARARARAKAPETSIKTTKPSPIKFFQPVTVGKDTVEKVSNAAMAAADRVKAKKNATTKTPQSKPGAKPSAPRGPLARAKALAEDKANRDKAATTKKPSDGNSTASPSLSKTRLGELKAAKEKKEPTKAKATVSNQGVKNLSAAIKAKATAKAAGKTETSVKEVAPKSNQAGKPASKTETSVKSPTMQMKKPGMKKKC